MAPSMVIDSVYQEPHHAQLTVRGVLDHGGIAVLSRRLHDLMEAGARFVVVDLSEVTSCDPLVLRVMSAAVRRLSVRQGWLRLIGIQPSVAAMLNTAELPDHFTMRFVAETVA